MRDSPMWRSSDQEALGLDRGFLQQQQQQQTPRNSHDTLFHRQHQTSQPQLSEQHPGEFMRAQTAGQANNNIAHGLPQALLAEAGHAADLPNMQLDLDSVTLSAALGLGGDNALAQFQRNLSDQNGQSSSDLSAILAASLGLPGQTSLGTLLGNEGLTGSLGATGMFNLPHLLPQTSLISSKVLKQSVVPVSSNVSIAPGHNALGWLAGQSVFSWAVKKWSHKHPAKAIS
ncbi:TPA: hypothetical protein ACH3X2_002991 [Trebouxia sp. C0005]